MEKTNQSKRGSRSRIAKLVAKWAAIVAAISYLICGSIWLVFTVKAALINVHSIT